MATSIEEDFGIEKKKVRPFLLELREATEEYKCSPYFRLLWKKGVLLKDAIRLRNEKLAEPTKQVLHIRKKVLHIQKKLDKDLRNDRKIIKKRQADLTKNNAALHKVLGMLDMIAQTADKHDTSGALKKDLQMAYLKNEDKMLSLEFWGKVVQKYATQSPEGKEACLKDISALGIKLGKDIKKNLNNIPSSAAKKYLCRREDESQKAKCVDQTNAAVKGKMFGVDGGR